MSAVKTEYLSEIDTFGIYPGTVTSRKDADAADSESLQLRMKGNFLAEQLTQTSTDVSESDQQNPTVSCQGPLH